MIGGARFVEERYDWKQPNRPLGGGKHVKVLIRPRSSERVQNLRAFVEI